MEIKGKVHCFFEQSGTFKNEFIKLGIPAEDYDIQDHFGETDHIIDLFNEIETAYRGGQGIFDNITKDDLIMAFFPCIYFCEKSQCAMAYSYVNYRKLTLREKTEKILERSENRQYFYTLLIKFVCVCKERGLRLIVENPYSPVHYLVNNFIIQPSLIDKNRQRRGDYYKKPTQYFFVNCEHTIGWSYQTPKETKTVATAKSASRAGLCSEERSLICPDYARNFICDYIIGKEQNYSVLSLFEV